MSAGNQTDHVRRGTGAASGPARAIGRPLPSATGVPARRRQRGSSRGQGPLAAPDETPVGSTAEEAGETTAGLAAPEPGRSAAAEASGAQDGADHWPDPATGAAGAPTDGDADASGPVAIDAASRNSSSPVMARAEGSGSGRGSGPTARRVTRNGGGPPVGPLAILAIAGVVLVILLGVILLSQGNEPRQETAAPCIQATVGDALTAIADGSVTNIRASAAANDLTRFAVAVELDIEGGGCLSLPQGAESVDQRTAIIGAATIYNSQTEGRQVNIEIDGIEVPPTPTPAPPTETPVVPPTETPVVPPTEPMIVVPPEVAPPVATPATPAVVVPTI